MEAVIESIDEFDFQEDTHRYVASGVAGKSVTELEKAYGLINYAKANPEILQRKAKLGRIIDQWTAHYDRTGTANWFTLPEDLEGYAGAWVNFRQDSGFEIVEIQKPLMSFIHGVLVGGTPDRIMRDRRGNILTPDIKCCSVVQPAWSVQTAFYEMLYTGRTNLRGLRCAVQLFPNGRFNLIPHEDHATDEAVVQSIVTLEAWKANNKLK